ncbi:TonB family protein [Alteromonadaceae bacterium 2753L.S.0a.02]|nr:TonB family protein [Alteromonadaceae bacterium 2753L.S.0a.02]
MKSYRIHVYAAFKKIAWLSVRALLLTVCLLFFSSCATKEFERVRYYPDVKGLNKGRSLGEPAFMPNVEYPENEWEKMREGWVFLLVDVTPDGRPFNITLVRYEPSQSFVAPAMEAMKNMRFNPYPNTNAPEVVSDYYVLINFTAEKRPYPG